MKTQELLTNKEIIYDNVKAYPYNYQQAIL